MKNFLAILLLSCVGFSAIAQTGKRIHEYPHKTTLNDLDMFWLENWDASTNQYATSSDIRKYVTNGMSFPTPTNFATFDTAPVYLRTSMWIDGPITNRSGLTVLWSYDLTNWANIRQDYGYIYQDPSPLIQMRDPALVWLEKKQCFYSIGTVGSTTNFTTITNGMFWIASPDLINWTNVITSSTNNYWWWPVPPQTRAMAPQLYMEGDVLWCQWAAQFGSGIYAAYTTPASDYLVWSTPVRIDNNVTGSVDQFDAWVVKDEGIYKMLNTVAYPGSPYGTYMLVYSTNNGSSFDSPYYPVYTNTYGFENHAWVKKGTNWYGIHAPADVYGRIRMQITNNFGYITPGLANEVMLPEATYPDQYRYYGARDLLPLTGVAKYRVLSAIDYYAKKLPTESYYNTGLLLDVPFNDGSDVFFRDKGPMKIGGKTTMTGSHTGSTNYGWGWANDAVFGTVFNQSSNNQYSPMFDAGRLGGMTNFTVNIWAKLTNTIPASIPDNYDAPIVGIWDRAWQYGSEWGIVYQGTNSTTSNSNRLTMKIKYGGYGSVVVSNFTVFDGIPSDGGWHMLTMTYKLVTSSNATAKLYVDGTNVISTTNAPAIFNTTCVLTVGGYNSGSPFTSYSPDTYKQSFPGYIRALKIWGNDFQQDEIRNLYAKETIGTTLFASGSTGTGTSYYTAYFPPGTNFVLNGGAGITNYFMIQPTNNFWISLTNVGDRQKYVIEMYGMTNTFQCYASNIIFGSDITGWVPSTNTSFASFISLSNTTGRAVSFIRGGGSGF